MSYKNLGKLQLEVFLIDNKNFKENINELEAIIKNKNWELLSKKLNSAKKDRSSFIN